MTADLSSCLRLNFTVVLSSAEEVSWVGDEVFGSLDRQDCDIFHVEVVLAYLRDVVLCK